jgi:hypothetical protein
MAVDTSSMDITKVIGDIGGLKGLIIPLIVVGVLILSLKAVQWFMGQNKKINETNKILDIMKKK